MTIALCCALAGFAAEKAAPGFSIPDFEATDAVAQWLLAYDAMAWRSSDRAMQEPQAVRAQLGREWFCLQRDDGWHAVFGRYDEGTEGYTVVLHYVLRDGQIVPSDDPVDGALLARYGRAIRAAMAQLPTDVTALGLAFNQYVRPMPDGLVEVWFLPAGQVDGRLVYGGDLHFVYDADARSLRDTYLNYEQFHVAAPDASRVLDIDRTSRALPSVGDLVFMRTFGDSFASTRVWTRCHTTTSMMAEGAVGWLHVEHNKGSCRKARKNAKP